MLYGVQHEERTNAMITGYEKIQNLATTLGDLSGNLKYLSHFIVESTSVETPPTEIFEKSKSMKKKVAIGNKKPLKPVSPKDIDRQLPQIMDNIYSSLIFKNTQQRIQYYKERDETINQHKVTSDCEKLFPPKKRY
jgi:hypothetical protein